MEIGSIFEINPEELFKRKRNQFYLPFMKHSKYDYHQFFNTGRSAIEFLMKNLLKEKIKGKILLPSFNCSSVIDAVKRANVDYEFYSITEEFQVNLEDLEIKLDDNVKFVFVIHYFGKYQNQATFDFFKKLQKKGIIVIEDISHALYTEHPDFIGFGDFVLGSIRKWLPIPDGGFLSSNQQFPLKNIEDGYNEYVFKYFTAQVMKQRYMENKNLSKEFFLNLNNEANISLFSDYTIRKITNVSQNYIESYDMIPLIKRRLENYNYLLENTIELSFIKPILVNLNGEVPFGFVVMCEERDRLRKHLIQNQIYCNIHWETSDECNRTDMLTKKISDRILTIPCDQRYGKKEMDYIVCILNKFIP